MTLPPFPAELVLPRADLLNLRHGCCLALDVMPQAVLERWLQATAAAVGGQVRVSPVGEVIIDMLGISVRGAHLNEAARRWCEFAQHVQPAQG